MVWWLVGQLVVLGMFNLFFGWMIWIGLVNGAALGLLTSIHFRQNGITWLVVPAAVGGYWFGHAVMTMLPATFTVGSGAAAHVGGAAVRIGFVAIPLAIAACFVLWVAMTVPRLTEASKRADTAHGQ
jgi:hypothetical protein